MSVNQSRFRYGAFTNSSLKIFDNVPVLETSMSSYMQEVSPVLLGMKAVLSLTLKRIVIST